MNQIQFMRDFGSDKKCMLHLIKNRWPKGISCPWCGNEKYYSIGVNRYKCAGNNCYKKFNPKTKTIFQDTKVPLHVWYYLIFCLSQNKKNVSSIQFSKNLGVTQKTMWNLMMRLRKTLIQDEGLVLSGTIEVDESFIAKGSRWTRWGGISTRKEPIFGLIERGGKVIIKTVPDRLRSTIVKEIEKHVAIGSLIYTDGHPIYIKLPNYYRHDYVEHSTGEYVRGDVHTNNIEGVWRLFKNTVRLAHHSISSKYCQAYCDELAWKFNNRHLPPHKKFDIMLNLCFH